MIELPVFNQTGQKVDTVQVDEQKLGGEVRINLLKQATVMYHANQRQGTVRTQARGTLKEILVGPAHENDGRMNLFGALRTSMATCGYESVKEFQKAEIMVAPALLTEGKGLQRSQGIGMGH